jgi:maltokinase
MTFPPAEPGFAPHSPESPGFPRDLVAEWMSRQRWYANKGALPLLEEIGSWQLPTEAPGVRIVTHLLIDHSIGKPALYQVPLTYRALETGDVASLIGETAGDFIYDAPHDAAYTAALLDLVTGERELDGDRTWVHGHRDRILQLPDVPLISRVLTGEQSNTSIIFESADGSGIPAIFKVFRTLHDGENPDVELQTALAAAGSDAVPRPLGHAIAEWNDRGQKSGRALGHIGFVQEFLRGAEDAWRVALSAAAAGTDFTLEARALGIATAQVHATLAATLPVRRSRRKDIDAVLAQMHGRLADAILEVPGLQRHAHAIREMFDIAAQVDWPAQQRIHGDLHLGQVLSVPGRGWVLVDFEGEPLRPMRERSKLDSPMRDVAGMLRSFDYVAGSLATISGVDPAAVTAWATTARAAFQEGYSDASGRDLAERRALVDAFEIDKALYEVVYEARNRPSWIGIPLAAIERLAARVAN